MSYIKRLARKVLSGKASEEEKLFLEEYYNFFERSRGIDDELNGEDLEKLQKSLLDRIHRNIHIHKKRGWVISINWRRATAASLLVLVLGAGIMLLMQRKSTPKIALNAQHTVDFMPAVNTAILMLDDGSLVNLDNMKSDSLLRQGNIEVSKNADGLLVYSVAKHIPDSDSLTYNTLTTPKGGIYQIVLPDGTKAWLNAASSIRFPTQFARKQRNVSITGEVYFEVAHKSAQPFIVTAGETSVEVLGTHFNVMAYPNEGVLKTTLAEGSVKISRDGNATVLKPGQQLQANNRLFKVKQVDVEAELAWKRGEFYFKEAGVEEVMRQIERWYNVDVKYDDRIPVKQFTGTIPRSATFSELMEMLSFYDDIKCVIQGNTITVKQQ